MIVSVVVGNLGFGFHLSADLAVTGNFYIQYYKKTLRVFYLFSQNLFLISFNPLGSPIIVSLSPSSKTIFPLGTIVCP